MRAHPMAVGHVVGMALIAAAAASCDSTEPPLPATHIAFVSQPAASSSADGTLGTVSVALLDDEDHVATHASGTITISLSAVDTAAHLTGTTTVSTSNGVATFPNLHVNKTNPGYLLVAQSGAMEVTSQHFAITPGAPAGVIFELPAHATAGQPVRIFVFVADANGNSVGSGTQSISLSLASSPPNDTLFGTTSVQATNGTAEFDDLSLHRAGAHAFSATATGLTGATSKSLVVDPGQPTKLVFTMQPADGHVGAALATFS